VSFSDIIGQEIPKRGLRAALIQNRLAHAYLFHGPDGVGKEFTAFQLAKAVNCHRLTDDACDECPSCRKTDRINHPDLAFLFPTPDVKKTPVEEIQEKLEEKRAHRHRSLTFSRATSIRIDDIRTLQERMAYAPYEGRKKVAILLDADRMPKQASNAFLKLLEEPTGDALLVLISTRPQFLLPTIRSRCQQVRFTALDVEEITRALVAASVADEPRARVAALLADGSLGRAREILEEDLLQHRENALALWEHVRTGDSYAAVSAFEELARRRDRVAIVLMLDFLSFWFQDLLSLKTGAAHRIRNVDLRERLDRNVTNLTLPAITEGLRALEDVRQTVQGTNVDPQLALFSLYTRLRGEDTSEIATSVL
jgi:DNA polymerase-3 subunit delta'